MTENITIQTATVPGTDVVVSVFQVGNPDFPFRTCRTANERLRIAAASTGFATEEWARSQARALWAEVVRHRDAAASSSTVGRNQGAAFTAVTADEIRQPQQVFTPAGTRKHSFGGSDKQLGFLTSLLGEISRNNGSVQTGEELVELGVQKGNLGTVGEVSKSITLALAVVTEQRNAQRKAAAAAPAVGVVDDEPVVEPGAYAVDYNGLLGFYQVEAGKGKWEGRVFLNRYHSDELGHVTRTERLAVKALIAADPAGARARFADETERCWMCKRRLTDVEGARARGGIGPECAKKV